MEQSLGDSPLYLRLGRQVVADPHLFALAGEAPPGQPGVLPLFAAVHFLLLGGGDHPLSGYYPSLGGATRPDGDLGRLFADYCRRHRAELIHVMETRRVQTNEVARAAVLLLGLNVIAARTELPLAVIEIGASAGLLLRWERYHYDFGPAGAVGDARSAVRIDCGLRGTISPPVPAVIPEANWRLGVDLDPVDPVDPLAAKWLEALVWPDQDRRRTRLLAAIEVAQSHPVDLVAGDAVVALPGLIARCPPDTALCVFHSMVLNQFTPEARNDLEVVFRGAGRPLSRLWMEWIGGPQPLLSLIEYDGGRRSSTDLANYHHHGDWVAWR